MPRAVSQLRDFVSICPSPELLDRRRFATKAEGRMAVFHFIEGWYNVRRRHSALGYEAPVTHERNHHAALAAHYS